MAGNISDYLENKLLDHALGKAAYTFPTNVRVALFTADPGEAGPGTEVSGGAYARQSLVTGAAASGASSNSADIVFPIASADWGSITHIAIFDATTVGNMLWHAPATTAKTIQTGDQYVIAAADLPFTLD